MSAADALLAAELLGTFVFAVSGALTAIQATRLDVVGVLALGTITALGGGVLRDVLLGNVPPRGLNDWRFVVTALAASALVFGLHRRLARFRRAVIVFDAAGLALFCVVGTLTALEHGASPLLAVLLGTITGVGGGTLRDLMVGQAPPTVLTSELYAVPAAVGSAVTTAAWLLGWGNPLLYTAAAVLCFGIRIAGVRFGLQAPQVGGSAHA